MVAVGPIEFNVCYLKNTAVILHICFMSAVNHELNHPTPPPTPRTLHPSQEQLLRHLLD